MLGTLAPPLQISPSRPLSLPGTPGFDRKMSLPCRIHCKAALHAFAEASPAVAELRMPPSSLYEVLRVNRNASPVEIKTAYRSLAKMYHPDAAASESDGRDFMEIHKAYATLSDPAERELYDLSLCASGGGRRGGPFQYSTATGYRTGYYTTRRWETDQCW